MKKNIIILTDSPGPPLYNPRMRYLIQNLHRRGWQFTVFAEQMPNETFLFEDCQNIMIPYYKGNKWKDKCLWLLDKLFNAKEKRLYRAVRKNIANPPFDLILCSAFNTYPLITARRLAKKWNLPLVVDLRDIAEQWGGVSYLQHGLHIGIKWLDSILTDWYVRIGIRQRNRTIRQAAAITTISTWHQKILSKHHSSVHLIYNGYDENSLSPKNEISSAFLITYTGKIFDFFYTNPHLLFVALKSLKQKDLLPAELQLHFYSNLSCHPLLRQAAQEANIQDIVFVHPFVPNEEIPNILHQTSIALVLTNKTGKDGPHGIMTTKFFEALGVEKPVLCVPSDEESLSEVIQQTNAGIAAKTAEEIEQFILDKYHEWQQNGFTRQLVNQVQKQRFTRQYQAGQFENLFLSLI